MRDPYSTCPILETEEFIVRLISPEDAEDLFDCYSDPAAVGLMNSDNCISGFLCTTLDRMKALIRFWLEEYSRQAYVRFSIIDKGIGKAVGTLEMFGRDAAGMVPFRTGILRIDLNSGYENRSTVCQLLEMVDEHFFDLFDVRRILTKAVPEAEERLSALSEHGYAGFEDDTASTYVDYYHKCG